ncbi:MAG: small ribosomal subunit biogenesis GTPase RsgA [Thiohalomonadales bacterium]
MSKKRSKDAHSSGSRPTNPKKSIRSSKLHERAESIVNTSQLGEPQFGRVIARFGVNLQVEDSHGELHLCLTRRAVPQLVCGDHVQWCTADSGSNVIVERLPRKTLLSRPNFSLKLKPVAANIDVIFIVAASEPKLDEDLINRYLVAAALTDIPAVLIVNKVDLFTSADSEAMQKFLQIYRDVDYPILLHSNTTGLGQKDLGEMIRDKIAIFVGQSGVGKSSIIQTLLPDQSLRIGALSDSSGLGKHTTSVTVLYPIPEGGAVIDSPGIREFGLGHVTPGHIAQGFVEFLPYISLCKFNDCKHDKEPNCSIKEQVKLGTISRRRYDSFKRIVQSIV